MEVERAIPEPPLGVVYKVCFNSIGQSIFIVITGRSNHREGRTGGWFVTRPYENGRQGFRGSGGSGTAATG